MNSKNDVCEVEISLHQTTVNLLPLILILD